MTIHKISQKQLAKLSGNLFTIISVNEPSLLTSWTRAIARADTKLIAFQDYMKEAHTVVKRGIATTQRGKVQPLTILSKESKAIKNNDIWVVKEVHKNSVTIRHRFLNEEFSIPSASMFRALRRMAGIRRLDVTNNLDYVVSKKFKGLERFLEISVNDPDVGFMGKWRKYVEERLGNFVVVRRMDISASGTSVLAFYSGIPEAPAGVSWSYKIPSDEDAKIMTMWFNCSLNILQTLTNRKETRGAFLQLDEYTLEEFQVLNPRKLSQKEKRMLTEAFEKLKDTDLESLIRQLKNRSQERVEIDRAVLKAIGFNENESRDMIDSLYPALANEIEKLKTLMEG